MLVCRFYFSLVKSNFLSATFRFGAFPLRDPEYSHFEQLLLGRMSLFKFFNYFPLYCIKSLFDIAFDIKVWMFLKRIKAPKLFNYLMNSMHVSRKIIFTLYETWSHNNHQFVNGIIIIDIFSNPSFHTLCIWRAIYSARQLIQCSNFDE